MKKLGNYILEERSFFPIYFYEQDNI